MTAIPPHVSRLGHLPTSTSVFFSGAEIADSDGLLEGAGRFMRDVKLGLERHVDVRPLTELIETAYADPKEHLNAVSSCN